MGILVTWTVESRKPNQTGELYLSKVHCIKGITTPPTKQQLRAWPRELYTLCGKRIGGFDPRIVKSYLGRPCTTCSSIDEPFKHHYIKKEVSTVVATTPANKKINFATSVKVAPPGLYPAILDSFKYVEANKSTGARMYTLIFKLKTQDEFNGTKQFRNYVIDGNAIYYFFEDLILLGADPEELSPEYPEGTPEEEQGLDITDFDNILKGLTGANVLLSLSTRSFQPKNPDGTPNGPERTSNNIDKIESL